MIELSPGVLITLLLAAFGVGGTWAVLIYKFNQLIRHVKETNGTLQEHSALLAAQDDTNLDIEARTSNLERSDGE